MKSGMRKRLQNNAERHQQLGAQLARPEALEDKNAYRELTREYAERGELAQGFAQYQELEQQLADAQAMRKDKDMRELAEEECERLEGELTGLGDNLYAMLIPADPDDERNAYLEIRAGTGGDEAALFAGDLYRMYARYCEKHRWKLEVINNTEGVHGGFREIITRISGKRVYGALKFESGAHRVQRVPVTETQGRIHTSACTVAVLPEPDASEETEIARDDLRIDTFRSSGAGGQHVNTTDSAIRITHLPSGLVVECQDERSQHKNRAKALALLSARLKDMRLREQQQAQAAARKVLVGSGDRSERIRTYNFPQGRVTDHRINLTLYSLDAVLEGELEQLINGLSKEYLAEQMATTLDSP